MRPSNVATRRKPTAAILIFLVGLSALHGTPASAIDCNSRDLSMRDMTECADQQLKRADTELNAVYAALMKKIEAPDQKRLRDAERAWVAFRDSECLFRTGGTDQGGTIQPMLQLQCRTELTEARAKDLRQQVKCPSFDLSCPAK